MFLSPSQEDSVNRVIQGLKVGAFFGESSAFPPSTLRGQREEEGLRQFSHKCQINNGQSSLVYRRTPGPLTVWSRPHHHALTPAHPRDRAGQRHFGGGAWNPQFQISWLLSICLGNFILSTLKRLLISFLNNKNLSEVVIKCIFIYLWE